MFHRKRHNWPGRRLEEALAPLTVRVRWRYWLETGRLVFTWGLGVAAGVLVLLRLTPQYADFLPAAIGGAAAAAAVLVWRGLAAPGALQVVRIADELGLNGKAITAYRLLERKKQDSWSRLAVEKGIDACRGLPGERLYPLCPSRRPWRGIIFLAGILAVISFLPAPLAPYWEARRTEKEALVAAARQAAEVVAQLQRMPPEQKEFLPEKLDAELNVLPETVGGARDRWEAARSLDQASQRLEDVLAFLEPAQRSFSQLTSAWKNSREPLLRELAAALEKSDAQEISRLAGKLNELANSPEAVKNKLALEMFQAGEAVGDPVWRENLRKLAKSLLSFGASGENEEKESASLARDLTSLARRAGAAGRLTQASAAMFNLAGALASGNNAAAITQAGSGTGEPGGAAGGSLGVAGSAPGAGSGAAVSGGAGGGASGDAGAGNGSGEYAGTAGGTLGGSGNGPGSGSGKGGGSGSNDGGSGKGAGGSGPGGQDAGTSGGGYDRIYAPHLLGGSGQQTRVSGQLRPGQAGTETSLPDSPVELGAVRPYREVLPLYREEAVNSLSAAPLPPDLEALVWQYFTSLE